MRHGTSLEASASRLLLVLMISALVVAMIGAQARPAAAQTAVFSIDSVTPSSAEQGAQVDLTLTGSGFQQGATLTLTNLQGLNTFPQPTTVNQAGTQLTANMTIPAGFPPGQYSMIVENPDGDIARLDDSFTITQASAPPPPDADTTAPTVSLTAPADGAVVSGTAVNLSANASDNVGVSKVEFLLNGSVVATDTTVPYSASWDSKTKNDGRYTLTAKAFDAAGNQKTSASRSIVVDNFFPGTSISGGPAEGSFTQSTSATFGLSSTDGNTFKCQLDSGPVQSCTSPKSYTGLSQGRHTFKAWAIGSAGEAIDTDQTPATRIWSVDSVKPRGTVKINGGAATTRSLRVKLSLRATDPAPASGVVQMRLSNDGRTWSGWQSYAVGKAWTLKTGASGTRTVFVQYKDKAGNVSATAKDTIRYRR